MILKLSGYGYIGEKHIRLICTADYGSVSTRNQANTDPLQYDARQVVRLLF